MSRRRYRHRCPPGISLAPDDAGRRLDDADLAGAVDPFFHAREC